MGKPILHALHDLIGTVAVGTALSGSPPHRSQRAELPHWAPASGNDAQAAQGIRMDPRGLREFRNELARLGAHEG